MSGGSYDYIYSRIEDIRIQGQDTDPRRAAFQKLLHLVAKAMHDIEWVDSCDYGPGDDHKAIDAVFAFMGSDPSIIAKAHAFDSMKERLQEFFNEKLETK